MDDELKIIIKAVLDSSSEDSINKQIKSLKIDPISLDIKVNSNLKASANEVKKEISQISDILTRKVNKNQLAKDLIKNFGITNRADKNQITKAVEEYQNALKIKNPDEITKSYDNLFNSIKNSFYNFTHGLDDYSQDYLNFLKDTKFYISDHIKGDLGKDGYKYYRDNLIGKITRDPKKGSPADTLYMELSESIPGILPIDNMINEADQFRLIADAYIMFRNRAKSKFDDDDILWTFGRDEDIKDSINRVINTFQNETPNLQKTIKNIKSDLVDLTDPNWNSLVKNIPAPKFDYDYNQKIKIPFQIDIQNPDEVKNEMERIVSKFTNGKGELVDYRVLTNTIFDENINKRIEILSGATLKYRNELDEVITKQLKWEKIGQELDKSGEMKAIMGFTESYSSYSQNIEKAIEKQEKFKLSTEKLENKLREYKKTFDNLQLAVDKSGVKLNQENISKFNESIDTKNLEQARHHLTMLQKEWQGLNISDISTEKLENKLREYKKSFENLQIKADKSGVILNQEDISKFNQAIDNKNLEQARHLLTMLQKEWQGLNAAMVKDTPNTALENMNKYISKMPYSIEAAQLRLKSLSAPSKELQDKVSNLKIQLENVYKSGSNEEKLSAYGKLKQSIIEVNAELSNQIKIQRQINQDKNLIYDKKTFSNRITTWINDNSKAVKVFGEDIEKLSSQIENADRAKLLNLKKQFQEITTSAKSMGLTGETAIEKIINSFKNLSSIVLGGSFAMYAVHSLREVYNNVIAIDTAMVNVKKVTDETSDTYNKFVSDSSNAAVKLGVAVTEIMNSTADFVRLGYSLKDAFTLSQTAAIYRNVSYTDIGTATKDIVSAMKAFKIEAKDSTSIIDKLNEVGNRFSISSAGLGEGLKHSASSLATANNTLDESLALITAANEVIQNPGEAGNAVKVLTLRLRNTKGELEKIGESTDGMVESVTKLQTQLLNLTNGKVNIMANPDTFKSTYQIMKEIANVWDDLTDVKRANILELIAGKHRANTITSILQNMKTAEEVVQVSLNSSGSAMREQEKRMDSINAKLEQMKATIQSFSSSFLDSSFIKLIIDFSTNGISSITKLVDTFGVLSTVLTAISTTRSLMGKSGGFFSLIKNEENGEQSLAFLGKELSQIKEQWQQSANLKDKIKTLFTSNEKFENNKIFSQQLEIDKLSIRNYISAIEHGVQANTAFEKTMANASDTAKNYAKNNDISSLSVKNFVSTQKSLNSATKSTTASTIALTLAETALNAAITMGLSFAFESIIAGINHLVTSQQRAIDTASELSSKYNEQMRSISDNSKNISSISKDYERLAKGVNIFGENVSLTNEEYRKYNDIANQIAEMFPQLVTGRTLEGNAILKQKGNVEALTKALKEQRQAANDSLIKNQEDIFKGFRQTSFEGVTNWTTHKDALYQQKQILDMLIKDIDSYDKLIENHADKSIYVSNLLKEVGIAGFDSMSPKSIFETLTANKNQILAHYRGIVSEINAEISKIQPIMLANLENKDNYKNLNEETQNHIRAIVNSIDIGTLSNFQNASQMNSWIDLNILQPITQNKDNVQQKLSELFSLESQNLPADEYINAVNSLVEQIVTTLNLDPIVLKTKLGFSDISSQIDETKNSLPALASEINSLDSSFDSIEKSINNMVSSLSLLDNTIKSVTDGTYLSGQEISKLILKYPELSDKILQTSKGYTFEIEVLQKLREEKINEQKTSIQAEIDITAQTLQNIGARLAGYQSEIGAINSVAQAKAALAEIDEQAKNENFFTKIWRGITGKPQINKVKSDLEQYIDLSGKVENAQKKINALNTSLSLVSMPNYTQAVNHASKATKDHNKALNDNKKALENQRKELEQQKKALDQQKKSLEDNQKSINSLIDMTVKMIKRQKENEKDALKQSLDGYKKKIDLMKRSLDIQKDEYHYQKELKDKNFEINKIQNKLSALQFDDSAAAQKKRKELQEKLKKDQEDLQKFLYDNGVERQKKALDNEYKQFKDSTDSRVKVIEDYLKQEGQIRIDAMNLIEGKSQEFYNNLMRWNIDYGDGMASTVINAWNKAYSALSRFSSGQINVANALDTIKNQMFGITSHMSGISDQMSRISSQIDNANRAMSNFSDTSRETAKALNLAAREYKNLNAIENNAEREKAERIARLEKQIAEVGKERGAEPSLGYYRRKLYDLRGYASGTFSAKKGLATVDENGKEIILDKSAPGRYRLMNDGDIVFSHEATKKLWDFANNHNNLVGQKFSPNNIKDKISYSKTLNNISSPIINVNIKGNADFEVVNALKRESENIIKRACELTFRTANKYAEIM